MPIVSKLRAFFPGQLHSRIFMVGGMVRDLLLGIESQDIDLAGAVPPEELLPLGFRLVQAKSTPPIYFLYHGDLGKIELTPLSDSGALYEDLERRDFTINAIAQSLDGVMVDPLGGKADLNKRLLRLCSPTSLPNDPARIFRAFRFECDGWLLHEGVMAALNGTDWPAELVRVPVERFSQEMLKALAKGSPTLFFRRLVESGTCRPFLAELAAMSRVPAGPANHHPEGDLFTHSLQVLEKVAARSPDVTPRFCAFFHDIGKLATSPELYPKHHGHETAGAALASDICRRLRLPVALQRALMATCRLHGTANRWGELRDGTRVRLALDAVKGGVAEFLPLIVAADCKEELVGWEKAVQVATLSTVELGLEPGYFERMEIPPEKRQDIIMQRRVEAFRKAMATERG